ncbi:MAG: efflux RND transporter periplasmic adaptor subunit [Acidobacteriota bacterium]|nr:MAG: efflux RND transporter periplasmic adaptor subunit [Acidobacteriota bacterium]
MTWKLILFLSLSAGFFWGCSGTGGEEVAAPDAHSHGGEAHTHADSEATVSVTAWSEDLELFMEHPVLSVGHTARFAVHLTKLVDFKPLAQGPILFRFSKTGVSPKMVTVGNPETPGIFGPSVTFEEAGDYTLRIEVLSEELETSLEVSPIRVSQEEAEESAEHPSSSADTISYLKEQQWKLPFTSAPVEVQEVHEMIRVSAEVQPKAGLESVVAVPGPGRFELPESGVPRLGAFVSSGAVVGYIVPHPAERSALLESQISAGTTMNRLLADLAEARARVAEEEARLQLAQREFERVQSLVEMEALPLRRLEEARSEVTIRESSLGAARGVVEGYRAAVTDHESKARVLGQLEERIELRAPISGRVVEIKAVQGQFVDAGETLFRIVDLSRVWLVANVFERDVPRLRSLQGGLFTVSGRPDLGVDSKSLVSIGSLVDPQSRTLRVTYEVNNPNEELKLGAIGRLDLVTSGAVQVVAVPRSAVLMEENRSVVYVQVGGETFERRIVRKGREDSNWIEVIEGVSRGERIVTLGPYDVALAGRSTEVPDHGHVH